MNTFLNDLIVVLGHEHELYGLVLQLLEAEETALLSREPEKALDLARRKETVLLRLQALEESRQILAMRLARQWGVRAADLSLREVACHAEEPERSRLEALREALRERLDTIRGAGERNSRLCRNGLDIIVRLFHGAAQESGKNAYGPARSAGLPRAAARQTDGAVPAPSPQPTARTNPRIPLPMRVNVRT